MDVEMVESIAPVAPASTYNRKYAPVPVDEAHPFELENYIANYSGDSSPSVQLINPDSIVQVVPPSIDSSISSQYAALSLKMHS